ncbi:hypothetical protein DIPPA_08494 [Diplonema papillatum]|nr:hypothetical protein DIPPA_08494 [Diplonema papillatum]
MDSDTETIGSMTRRSLQLTIPVSPRTPSPRARDSSKASHSDYDSREAREREREVFRLQGELDKLAGDLTTAKDGLRAVSSERDNLEHSCARITKENAALQSRLDAATTTKSQASAECDKHKRALMLLESKFNDLAHAKIAADDKAERLRRSQTGCQSELERAQHTLSVMQEKLEAVQREKADLASELQQLERGSVSDRERCDRLQKQNLQLEADLRSKDLERARLQDRAATAARELETAEEHRERLKQEQTRIESGKELLVKAKEDLATSVETVTREKNTLWSELEKTRDEKNALHRDANDAKRERDRKGEELERNLRQKVSLEERVEVMREQLNTSLRDYDELLRSRAVMQDELDRLRREQPVQIEASERACAAAMDDVQHLQSEFRTLGESSDRLKREYEHLQDKLTAEVLAHDAEKREKASLKQKLFAAEAGLQTLQQELNNVATAHHNLASSSDGKMKTSSARIADLERRLSLSEAAMVETSAELSFARESNEKLETEMVMLRRSKEADLQMAADTAQRLEDANAELKIDLEKACGAAGSDRGAIESLRNDVSRHMELNAELRGEYDRLNSRLQLTNAEMSELKRKGVVGDAERARLEDECGALRAKVELEKEEVDLLVQKLRQLEAEKSSIESEARSVLRDAEAAVASSQTADRRLATARTEADHLLHELRSARRERDDTRAQLDELERTSATAIRERRILQNSFDECRLQVSLLTESGTELRRDLGLKEEEVRSLRTELERMVELNEESKLRLAEFAERESMVMVKLNEQHAEAESRVVRLEMALESAQQKLACRDNEIVDLKNQVKAFSTTSADVRASADMIKENERLLRVESSELKASLDRANLLRQEDNEDHERELMRLRAALHAARAEADDTKNRLSEVEAARSMLQLSFEKQQVAKQRQEAELNDALGELRSAGSSLRMGEVSQSDLKRENGRLLADLENLRSERAALKQTQANLAEEVNTLKNKVASNSGNTSYSRLLREAESLRAALESSERRREEELARYQRDIARPVIPIVEPAPILVSNTIEHLPKPAPSQNVSFAVPPDVSYIHHASDGFNAISDVGLPFSQSRVGSPVLPSSVVDSCRRTWSPSSAARKRPPAAESIIRSILSTRTLRQT